MKKLIFFLIFFCFLYSCSRTQSPAIDGEKSVNEKIVVSRKKSKDDGVFLKIEKTSINGLSDTTKIIYYE